MYLPSQDQRFNVYMLWQYMGRERLQGGVKIYGRDNTEDHESVEGHGRIKSSGRI